MKKKILFALILFLVLFFNPLNNTLHAATIRCAYSSFANSCQIQSGATCPSGTHPAQSCPPNCSSDFDIQCISDSIPTPPPTPIPTDCSQLSGMCQPHNPRLCLGNMVASTQCASQIDTSGSSYWCCLPGPDVVPPTLGGSGPERCGDGINTAIGCIPVLADDNGVSFMAWVLRWAVGIGGGIAFMLIIYGGFMYMTSQGNPERVKAGQELITSAVSGLLLLVLSIFLLNFIGVDILHLNLFGFGQ